MQEDEVIPAFKIINTIYLAIGAGMLITAGVFYYLVESGGTVTDSQLASILQIAVLVAGVGGFGAGRYLYGTFSARSKAETMISQKLTHYRTALLISWAAIEGPGLFALVAYLLSGDQLFLAFFAMIFLVFVFTRPTVSKFQQDF